MDAGFVRAGIDPGFDDIFRKNHLTNRTPYDIITERRGKYSAMKVNNVSVDTAHAKVAELV